MRSVLQFTRLIVLMLGLLTLITPVQGQEAADPLASWNDGSAKKAILDYVKRVTTEG